MNDLQRSEAIRLLGEGATLEETRGMIESGSDFAREWTTGKQDAEAGNDSELADWYLQASAARLRIRAVLRAEAVECAGEKRSGDLLAVVRALEAEPEPVYATDTGVREASPILSLADKIDTESDPVERDRLQSVQREAELALHALFAESVRPREEVTA